MSTLPEDDVALSSHSEYHSQHSEETVDDPLLTPSSLVGTSELGDPYDSESLPSTVIRPATASAVSQDDDDKEGQDLDELEYIDEPPVLTPLTFQGLDDTSLLISLDSFGVPDDWEFVLRPPEINGVAATFEFEPGDPPAAAEEGATPSEGPTQSSSAALDGRSVEESFKESSQAVGPIVPEDSVDNVAADVESDGDTEEDVDETETDLRKTGGGAEASLQESGGAHQSDQAENDWTPELTTLHFPSGSIPDETDRYGEEAGAEHQYLDDGQAENEWTPVLPALHFHSPSLSDEVLGSPEFNAAVFGQDGDDAIPAASPRAVPRSRHLRALSTSNVERTSILWAPMETKYGTETARSASAKGKGKARPRARTVSDGSGFAGTEDRRRVEREVQTAAAEVDDRHALRAKYTRLKSELRSERVRVAGLMRDGEAGRWEAKLVRVFNYISGGFTSDLEDVIQ
ncbi:hypothetical protein B0H11DRAFT_1964573 [Mycena galericulata]|nr:hypothetical protein B0H11DRAFT_1964573 [Mycena galericulata]